jgi:hypothetical protein
MANQLTNMTISKIYEGPSGESEYGPWKIYNLYLTNAEGVKGKKKFGYMWSGKKPVPKEGMKVVFLEYEVTQKGEYTNYNIKEIKFAEGTGQVSKSDGPAPKEEPKAYIDHGKVALSIMEKADYNESRVVDLVALFKVTIKELLSEPEKSKTPEEPLDWSKVPEKMSPEEYGPEPDDSDVPF